MADFQPMHTPAPEAFRAAYTTEGDDYQSLAVSQAQQEEPEAPEPEPVDIDALVSTARSEGRAEAEAELAVERERLQQIAATLEEAVQEAARSRRETLEKAAEDIGQLVLLITRRIVDDSLAMHPDALPALVRDALANIPEEEEVWITVAPGSVEQVVQAVEPPLRDHVVADPDIVNGCVVRTRNVSIEATVEAAMAGIGDAIAAWLAEQPWSTEWMYPNP